MTQRHKDALRLPRPGTRLRKLYDVLSDGMKVSATAVLGANNRLRALADLRDYYGCEIRREGFGPTSGVRMLGRWDGPFFVPVERLHREDA